MDSGRGTAAKVALVERNTTVRVALGVEYDGSAFHGWQRQQTAPMATVQEHLERALSAVAAQPIHSYCAGRTDTGVHACAQVAHFDASPQRALKAWSLGTNSYLPAAVRVLWSQRVAADFHARFSARSRVYRYLICNRSQPLALFRRQLAWERAPLDVEAMREAGQYLLGSHDFSAFRAAACHSSSPRRHMMRIDVQRDGDLVTIEIEANAFLLHMVRNLVGTLMVIGRGEASPHWCAELLRRRDRRLAGPTAVTDGLYFLGARYDACHGIPALLTGPLMGTWSHGLGAAVAVDAGGEVALAAQGATVAEDGGHGAHPH